jgi:hypothetical protein
MANIIGNQDPNEINGTDDLDNILGLDGNDIINGLLGDDVLNGNRGADRVFGGDGSDTLYGGKDNDTLSGDDGNDTLFGDLGDDLIQGGTGDDLLFGEDGNDTLRGGNGNDNLFGREGNDTLFGDIGDDFLNGNQGNDEVLGGDGADTLRGGQGDDILVGGTDSDFLWGDKGTDTLTGGTGSDRFVLQSFAGRDLITDYDDAEDFLVIDEADVSFDDLNIEAITTIGEDNTLIESAVFSLKSTGKVIAILQGVSVNSIQDTDFRTIDGEAITSSGTDSDSNQNSNDNQNTNDEEDINDLNDAEDLGILSGTQTIDNGSLSDSNTADIYRFRLESDADFETVMNNLSANADLQLIQDDGNGTIEETDILQSSTQAGTSSERIQTTDPLTAGVYYVRVLRVEGDTTYDLTLEV